MNALLNSSAPHHLPAFITTPGDTDVLALAAAAILVLAVLAVGLLFLRLHTLPERIAHKGHKLQFEIVAVLGLLSLFTHVHLFWVIGLMLALIDLPDFGGTLGRMARALERIASSRPGDEAAKTPEAPSVVTSPEESPPPTRALPRIVPANTGS